MLALSLPVGMSVFIHYLFVLMRKTGNVLKCTFWIQITLPLKSEVFSIILAAYAS